MSLAGVYGMVAEFDSPRKLVEAARAVRQKGYRRVEAYTPYPIKALDEILPALDPVPFFTFCGGVTGLLVAWAMEFYIAVYDFPLNVGGRPLNSWPAFVPIMFELTVLFAAAGAFFGALWLCGFPKVHHPIFNFEQFRHAASDRFFLCIESSDLKFMPDGTREFLLQQGPINVWQVDDE